jgi:hypothetical protein
MGYLVRPKVVRLLRVSEVDIIDYIIINNIRYVLILDLLRYFTTY